MRPEEGLDRRRGILWTVYMRHTYTYIYMYTQTDRQDRQERHTRTVVAEPLPRHPHDAVDGRVVLGAVGGREAGVLVHLPKKKERWWR